MNSQILIDTSFLYGLYNTSDRHHQEALEYTLSNRNVPLIPEIILPEVTYLFQRDMGHYGIATFLEEFSATQTQLQSITINDIGRAHEIMTRYAASAFDFVDCCLMALSERLEITQICTFDRRDFSIFLPRHCEYLELLP